MSNLYKNTTFWSWNADIELDEAISQLKDFKQKGFGGVFVHARGGLEIEYLGKEWFNIFDKCVEWAKQNDFDIWLYDEFGWPSGFGGGKVNGAGEEYQIKHLVKSETQILDSRHKLHSTFVDNGKTYYVYVYTDKNYVDLLNIDVTKRFILSTHEVYYNRYKQYFGNVIKGIFTDEPQVFVFHPYSLQIVKAFKEKFDIDFDLVVKDLFIKNNRTKDLFYKYYSVIAELFTANFTEPISKWCSERGIVLTGHFAEEDGLTQQYRASGGVMRNYQLMQQPGIDFLGRRLASPVLLKQVCSVKNQFSKPIVLSETFGCSGWNVSFAQLSWLWGYQAGFGINKACLHLSAYTIRGTRKRDYPAFYSYQQPWWQHFGAMNKKMQDVNEFISYGATSNDILLISPLSSTYFQQYRSERVRLLSSQFRLTVEHLTNRQYPFDIGDERIIRDFATVTKNGIKIADTTYRYVIVAMADNLERETFEILKKFVKGANNVAFINSKPKTCSGGKIPKCFNDVLSGVTVMNTAKLIEKYLRSVRYERKVKLIDKFDGNVVNDVVINVTQTDSEVRIFAQNTSCDKTVDAKLFSREKGQFYFNRKLDTQVGANGVYTNVSIAPMSNACIKLVKGEIPQRVKDRYVSSSVLKASGASLSQLNSLNVDKAYFEIDGTKSDVIDTVLLQDEINSAINRLNKDSANVNVTYSFKQNAILNELCLAVETRGAQKILYNGVDITRRFNDWYIDKQIKLANVTDLQRVGLTTVTASYSVCAQRSYNETLDGFETERNLFHYKSEPESIYLVGDFLVKNDCGVVDDGYLTTEFDEFVLDKFTDIDYYSELTAQGLYFYRGGVNYDYNLIKGENEEILVSFNDFYGATASVSANGKTVVIINPLDKTDITQILKNGDNKLTVTLYGSNRNLLGPFHHKSGESAFVGNSTFRGKKGFEDVILYDHFNKDTYDKKYHFVKLGLGALIVHRYEKD